MLTKTEIKSKGYNIEFTNGTGAGGQKRNRTYSCAVLTHIETGLVKRCDDGRSALKNMNQAFEDLEKIIKDQKVSKQLKALNEKRQLAIDRGTIRTYDFKRKIVKNHLTGQEAILSKVLNGKLELINSAG